MSGDGRKISQRRLDALPTEGYGVQVDGKIKAEYTTSQAAMTAGLIIKKSFPAVQVVMFDASDQTRVPIELPKETAEA